MKKNIKMAAVACMLLSAFATVSCDKNTDNGGENPPQGETFELGDGSKDNFEIVQAAPAVAKRGRGISVPILGDRALIFSSIVTPFSPEIEYGL